MEWNGEMGNLKFEDGLDQKKEGRNVVNGLGRKEV